MGCGASKGKGESKEGSDDIEFKKTGVESMDNFFDRAGAILEGLKNLTGPLSEQKEKLFESTGFFEVPGAGSLLQ